MSNKLTGISLSSISSDLPISEMSISKTPQSDSFFFLSEEDKQEINAFVSKIDITDSVLVFNYGESCRIQIAKIYDSIFNRFLKKENNHIKEYINQISKLLTDFASHKSSKKNSIFLKQRFLEVKDSVHQIANELDSQHLILMHDNDALLDFNSNLEELYITITKYIIAGEKRLDQVKTGILPELAQKRATSSNSAEEYNRLMQCMNTFEQKLHSLRTSQTIALQMIAQINIELENNKILIEMSKETLNNTIPAWENSIIL